jgi:Kelch motif protein
VIKTRLLLPLLLGWASAAVAQTPGFIPTGNMITPREGHAATLLPDGKVLITGGHDPTQDPRRNTLASAEVYDPETGVFTPGGNMTTERAHHTATLLLDGRVLIASGQTAELYDPKTSTFTATGKMVVNGLWLSATLLDNGKVLFTRGCSDYTSEPDPELYDPIAGTFSVVEDHLEKPKTVLELLNSCGPATSLPNGKVLFGNEIYNPSTNTLNRTGERTKTLGTYQTTATLLTNGRALLTGGIDDVTYSASAEFYDVSTGLFSIAGKMTRPRADHTATLLRDGTVLLAGGQLYPGASASAEIYDSGSGTFTATPDMTFPRFFHQATLLMDGRILITGGDTCFCRTTNSDTAELYVPSLLKPAALVKNFQLDRAAVVAGSSYSVSVSGSNLTPLMFLDVRFTSPESTESEVILNWQRGLTGSHSVPAGTASGTWTISGVRAHEIETDHTGNFFPVSATITVSQ